MCRIFRRISQLRDNAHSLNLENCLLYLSSTISQFFDFIQCMVVYFVFYCVTMHTLYRSFSRDVITFQNLKLKIHQIFFLIRHKRQHSYICLQFYISIACFVWKSGILNFWVMKVRDTRLRSSLLKNIYLSHDFEPLEVKALGKLLM